MLKKVLSDKKTFKILLLLNLLSAAFAFIHFREYTGGDYPSYSGLADGLIKGRYSFWYFLNEYIPDTFRNPGYVLFLVPLRSISCSILFVQIVQLIMYCFSVGFILSLIGHYYKNLIFKNIFLSLLFPGIYIAAYNSMIFPEILVSFLIALSLWIQIKLKTNNWWRYIFLGLLYGFLFQVRPVFLFIPVLFFASDLIFQFKQFSFLKNIALLFLYFLTMLPYGYWNKVNNGVFSITSLEGGGGVFHLGYWACKLPDYYVTRYWDNYCAPEMITFVNDSERSESIKKFNHEWDLIDSICKPLLTKKDSVMLRAFNDHPELFKTFNSEYVREREKLLRKFTIEDIMNDKWFYFKVKLYSAARLWVTGIPVKEMNDASLAKKIELVYPFFITGITFLLGLIFIPVAFIRHFKEFKKFINILVITVYFGLIHIPFTIQARYTIPVRFELLFLISISIGIIYFKTVYDKKAE